MDEKEINNIILTYDKNTYTLYFTRATVEAMENNGFDIREFDKKVFSNIMMLWYGAFAAQHRDTKRVTMDKIWKLIPNKEEMIKDLVALYSKPYNDLMEEPIDDTKKNQLESELTVSSLFPLPGERETSSQYFYKDIFKQVFSDYLVMGMTYDEFYNGKPWLAKAYRDAYRKRLEEQNTMLWIQGMYVYHSIGDYIQFYNPFVKHPMAGDYMQKPIPINEKIREKQELEKMDEQIEKFKAQAKILNQRFEDKQDG